LKDIKGIIRSRKSNKDRQYNGKKTKGKTIIYKTLHRKLNIEQQESTKILGKDRIVIVTNGTYPWSFVSEIFRNG
jgi:hypothetical protein